MNEEEDDHADGAASADDEDDSQLLDDVAAQHQILAPQQIALVLAAEREQSLSQSEGDNSGHIAPRRDPPPLLLRQHVLSLGGQTPGSRRSLGAVQSALYDRFGGSSEQGRQSSARQEHLAGPLSPPPIATGTHTRRVQPRLPHAAPAAGSVGGDANEDDANAAGPPPAPAAGAAGGENQLTGLDTAEDDLDTVEDDLFDAVEDNSLQSLIHFLSTITTRENVISVVKRFDNAKAVRLFAGLSTVLKEIEECELIKTSQEEEDDDDGGDSDEVTGAVNYLYVAAFLIEGYLEGLVSRRRAVDKPLEIIKEAFEVAELLYVQLESLDSLETNDAWQAKQKIFSVCELWWTGNFQDRDQLIADLIMLLLRDSLNEDPDECDVKRLYSIRSAINLLDFNDESLDRFKKSPTGDGQQFGILAD
ncbi:hypothetical protein THAOC_01732 [Thalassiosira oceanica]|uniref:Uncharacterized protein n=1 Tax=Thalassiosira oceanica TaxID=159749 RepID=K0TMT4_THAOC|nr:hypothetical protein THAOC_01732 [Thalassiosira oceanica]|eukprot:EJK76501.1 hypothetical protein THAOC_01732 [Thalassiosira oceanica]